MWLWSPPVSLQYKLQLTAVQDGLQVKKLVVQLENECMGC